MSPVFFSWRELADADRKVQQLPGVSHFIGGLTEGLVQNIHPIGNDAVHTVERHPTDLGIIIWSPDKDIFMSRFGR